MRRRWLLVAGVLAAIIAGGAATEWQAQKRITAWKTLYEKGYDHWVTERNQAWRVTGEATKERNQAWKERDQARKEVARLRRLLAHCQDKEAVQTEWIHRLWGAGLVPECRGVPVDSAPGADWRR